MTRLPLIALVAALCPAAALAQTAGGASDGAAPVKATVSAPAKASPPPPAPPPAAAAMATPVVAPPRHYGAYGLDLAARDLAVKPGDDFERYTSGTWLDAHQIPADKPAIGVGFDVFDRTQDDLRSLITTAPPSSGYGLLYATFMDEGAVEAAGDKPLRADIARLDAIKDKAAFARDMGSPTHFGMTLFDAGSDADTADPTMNTLWIDQAGIGMPDRDYYLTDQFKPQRDAYLAYITRTFASLGHPDPAGDAAKVLAFETAIAKVSWTQADRRDIGRINNPLSTAELAAFAPGFDWAAYFSGMGVAAQPRMIVQPKSAIRDIAALYAQTPLATLKLWQTFHIADEASPYLAKAWVDSRFAYVSKLSGVTSQRPRWKRGVALVDGQLGELVGKDYVARYFTPEAKAKMQALVANLKAAMGDRIRANDWMSASTKQAALDKLNRMTVMVGYPNKFRDYSQLQLRPGDLYGDVERAGQFNTEYKMADLGKPVDRAKWAMNPQTVNAYNGGLENKIVFPAGILQPPYFDPSADDAVNYGAIGAIIGHEISHGFDDQGRKIDASGAVRDWWTPQDATRFEAQTKVFGGQYAKFEAAPGAFINPDLTMGENIADFAGIQVALDAYHRSLNGKPAKTIDGLTGDQRFFLSFAQAWRAKNREDATRQQVSSDPHSPDRFRILGPLRNVDAWYAAFGVKPGDTMYIPPAQRARIW